MKFVTIGEFSAKFDGPALEDHEMDATYLGVALLGLGELFREAQQVVDPLSGTSPRVKVKQVRPGSFEVVLGIDYTFLDQAVNLFTTREAEATEKAVAIGAPLVTAVIYAIRKIKAIASRNQGLADELLTKAGDELIDKVADRLAGSKKFRRNVAKLSKPVTEEGIDGVSIRNEHEESLVDINQEEANLLQKLEDQFETDVIYEDAIVEIGTPQIDKPMKKKWGIVHPEYGAINARLLDDTFADLVVRSQVIFRKGLRFNTRLRVESTPHPDGSVRRLFEICNIQAVEDGTQTEIDVEE